AVQKTPVWARAGLTPGARVDGPAIVCDATSTVVVEPGWQARLDERGDLVLTDTAPLCGSTSIAAESGTPDPVQLEIFGTQSASIAEHMGAALRKTAVSTNIKERLDFSCALFTAAGDLVANAAHIPVHLGAMSETVRAIARAHPELAPGDVFVTNDPY